MTVACRACTYTVRAGPISEIGKRQGIPITTVPRTLVDLASSLSEAALARACHEAGVLYRTTPTQVDAVLSRLPNAPGRANLERVLHGKVPVTLSKLESRFLKLLREARLSLPITNRIADGHRVDCRWPEHRITVELDSYRFHNSRYACDKDRLREREARSRGDEFRRYTWGDVIEDPDTCSTSFESFLASLPATRRSRSSGRASPRTDPRRLERPSETGSRPRAGRRRARGWSGSAASVPATSARASSACCGSSPPT